MKHVGEKLVNELAGRRGGPALKSSLVTQQRTLGGSPDDREQNDLRFIFHMPPFNSVNHLHLHCLGYPYNNFLRYVLARQCVGTTRRLPFSFVKQHCDRDERVVVAYLVGDRMCCCLKRISGWIRSAKCGA
jgi:hypothetical protein